ncbi:ATP-dependent DNA ligase [Streptomyces mirabilis]
MPTRPSGRRTPAATAAPASHASPACSASCATPASPASGARSGTPSPAAWGDLALAGHHLPAGTVLDGEAVITTENGRISFEATQARAASSPTRAHRLATQRPAHYIAFDALQLPSGNVRPRPYSERHAALLNLLAELPANTPIQAVSATTDRDTALTWYNTLHNQGCFRLAVVLLWT